LNNAVSGPHIFNLVMFNIFYAQTQPLRKWT